jgi:hypothetical protein
MKSIVIELNFANELPPSDEYDTRTARVSREDPPSTPSNERDRRAVAFEELCHAAERVVREPQLRKGGVETPNALGSGERR